MTDYAVVIEEAADGGWWAHAPDLPGVVSTGDDPRDAREKFREAVELYREELLREGKALPPARSRWTTVTV